MAEKFGRKGTASKSKTTVKERNDYVSAKFINRELTKDEAAICKTKAFSDSDHVNALDRLMEDDYKVTFSHDNYHNCYTCALVPLGAEHVHSGSILTGKGSTATKAFKQVLFIHYELFDAAWPSGVTRQELELDD